MDLLFFPKLALFLPSLACLSYPGTSSGQSWDAGDWTQARESGHPATILSIWRKEREGSEESVRKFGGRGVVGTTLLGAPSTHRDGYPSSRPTESTCFLYLQAGFPGTPDRQTDSDVSPLQTASSAAATYSASPPALWVG